MSREIKFRVWEVSRKKFDEDIYNITDPDDCSSFFGDCVCNGDDILQQYTGLKDKNGKEIYEGDILDTDDGNREVVFRFGKFGVHVPPIIGVESIISHDDIIIGNIYENPQLLDG